MDATPRRPPRTGGTRARAESKMVVVVRLETPREPPKWALLEREMLQSLSDACEEFFCKFGGQSVGVHSLSPILYDVSWVTATHHLRSICARSEILRPRAGAKAWVWSVDPTL